MLQRLSKLRPQPIMLLMGLILTLNTVSFLFLSLSEDGAHYALYGTHLDWGYVDHPPLIGWIQAALLALAGHHDWAMHSSALLISCGILYTLFRLTRTLFPQQNQQFAYWCVFACFLSAFFFISTELILTQNPLRLSCLLSILLFYRYCQSQRTLFLLLTGVCLGLAGLSDFTAFMFALGLAGYALLFHRPLLRNPWLYVALTLAIGVVSPFIIWNSQHHFISFVSGSHRVVSHAWSWASFFTSLGIQFIAYSPALVIFSLIGSAQALRQKLKAQLVLVLPAIPVLLLFLFIGGFKRIDIHWPALGWTLLIPIAVHAIHQRWQKRSTRLIVIASIVLQLCAVVFFYMQALLYPISIHGRSPLYELYGWQQAADHAIKLETTYDLPANTARLFVNHWSMASRLAWYSQQAVQMAKPTEIASYHQFERWYGLPNTHSNGIMVILEHNSAPARHSAATHQFQHCDYIDSLPILSHHQHVSTFQFYHCWHYNRAPKNKPA